MHCQVLFFFQVAIFREVREFLKMFASAKGESDVAWVFPGGFGRGAWFSLGGFLDFRRFTPKN
jgi:hypothetical protein